MEASYFLPLSLIGQGVAGFPLAVRSVEFPMHAGPAGTETPVHGTRRCRSTRGLILHERIKDISRPGLLGICRLGLSRECHLQRNSCLSVAVNHAEVERVFSGLMAIAFIPSPRFRTVALNITALVHTRSNCSMTFRAGGRQLTPWYNSVCTLAKPV